MKTHDPRYNVTLPPQLDEDFTKLTKTLGATKSEVMRRALILLKHAAEADSVKLVKDGTEQTVLVK